MLFRINNLFVCEGIDRLKSTLFISSDPSILYFYLIDIIMISIVLPMPWLLADTVQQ